MKVDAVIFDMDGLMFDTERVGYEGFTEAAKLHGYEPDEFFKSLVGMNVAGADQAMIDRFGDTFPIENVRKHRAAHVEHVRNTTGIPTMPGLLDLLSYLQTQPLKLAIASSSTRAIVEDNLSSANIMQRFAACICGDEITYGKPHPEIYLKAAGLLSVSTSNCIVLEDSLHGIKAAYTAGMTPIMVPDLLSPTAEARRMSHRIFKSLHEVKEYLEKLSIFTMN